jgi:hypothetical protein
MELPDTLNPDLVRILGMQLWHADQVSRLMRDSGAEVPFNAAGERAHVLHWLLGLYAKHGAAYRDVANQALRAMQDRADINKKPPIDQRAGDRV